MATELDSPTLGRGADWGGFYEQEPFQGNDPFSPSAFGLLLFSAPDAAAAADLLGVTSTGALTFEDIGGTLLIEQLPPGSLVTVDSIGEDALYFYNNATGLPSLVSTTETVAFISGVIGFSDLAGTISIDQLPSGTVLTLDPIDEDAIYFFDNTLFEPRLLSASSLAGFLSGSLSFSDIGGTISLAQFPPGTAATIDPIDEDAFFFFNNTTGLPELISVSDAATLVGGGGGSGSYTLDNTARVDATGSDATGTVGDAALPFLTVQAALDALALTSSPTVPGVIAYIDIGTGYFTEALTTSMELIGFRGLDSTGSLAFSSLTVTGPVVVTVTGLNTNLGDISSDAINILQIHLNNVYATSITNTGVGGQIYVGNYGNAGSSQVSNVTSNAGTILFYGVDYIGTVNAGGADIKLFNCIPTDRDYGGAIIDSTGSAVEATFSLISSVTAAATLLLKDSRVIGSNAAGATTYTDLLLAGDDTAYNATTWNGDMRTPTKNALRDKFESLSFGSGDVVGPSSSVNSELVLFDSTTGKLVKRATGSGLVKATSGVYSNITDNSSNWDTAYTDRFKWDGGATGLTAATGRTSLGIGTVATLASDTDGTLAANSDSNIATQKAVKTYIDGINTALVAAIAALDSKNEVAYCSTSALPTCTYSNGSSGVGATLTATTNGPLIVDSATIVVGAVGLGVLVAGQASDFQNGWYSITQQGVVAVSPWILTRRTTDDQAAEIGPGYLTAVEAPTGLTAGTANNQKVFLSISPTPFVVGTSSLTFALVGGTYTAGNGLTLSGTAFSINTAITADLSTAQSLTNKKLGSLTSNGFVKTGSGDGTLSVDTASYQPLDSDLTTIAGLTATTDNFIVSVSSAWASRTPSQVRTTLGLVIGTNVQAYDADLDAWAAKTTYAGSLTITTGKTVDIQNTVTLTATDGSTLAIGAGGTLGSAAYTSSGAYQPLDSDLTTIAGLTATTDNFIVSVSSAWASRTPTQVKTTLGLTIGTNVQAWDADLDALAALSGTNSIYYRSASNTWTEVTIGSNLTFSAGTLDAVSSGGVSDTAYDATTWNAVTTVAPSKNAVRDKFETLRIGTDVQAYDADLTTWAGITPASGIATFLATPTSANLRSAMTDELGTGACIFDGATLVQSLTFATNSTSLAPFNIPAGTLKTTPADGDFEADADCFYACTDAGNRGVLSIRHFIRADSTVTYVSNTNAQTIFTTPANGRITLETGTYRFEGMLAFTSMSATSGNLAIDILGTGSATTGAWLWRSFGQDLASGGGAGAVGGMWSIASASTGTSIVSAATATAMGFYVVGSFEITGAGTLIPNLTMLTGSASVLSVGSYLMFERIGSTSVTSVGQWD